MRIPAIGKVIIKPYEEDTVMQSAGREFERKGEVLEVGTEQTFLKKGDVIYYDDYAYRRFGTEEEPIYMVALTSHALQEPVWLIERDDTESESVPVGEDA